MKSPVLYSAKTMLSAILLVSVGLYFIDPLHAKSFAIGGLIYTIPNLYFVHYAFRYSGAHLAPLVARSFSWGESGKIALAAMGFVLAYRFIDPLHKPMLFAGFISMIVLQWFVAFRIASHIDARATEAERDKSEVN